MEFQALFLLEVEPNILVAEALRSSPPVIAFRRELPPIECGSWGLPCAKVGSISLNNNPDKV